jgi:oligopeptidase B
MRKLTQTPPTARKETRETRIHDTVLRDDYGWLCEKQNPEVTAYLEAENSYAAAYMAPLANLRETLYEEMVSHMQETDQSVSYRDGGYWYYTRTEKGLQYPIYCRKVGSLDAPEQIILDVNKLAEGEAFMALGGMDITDDGSLLAYSTDTTGFRQYTLHILNLSTGAEVSGSVERTGSLIWAADNQTLFYTIEDEEQKRQYQLLRHRAGTPHAEDAIVFEEKDERFNLGAGRTRDGKFLLLETASHTTSEQRFLAADKPNGEWTLLAERINDQEYYADHRNGLWFIRTNDAGRNFRLVTAPVVTPDRTHWQELIPHRAEAMLEEIDLFADFYVACERVDGLPRLRVVRFTGDGPAAASEAAIPFPEPTYSAQPHINREWQSKHYRYGYQSLITPNSVFEYEVATGAQTLLKQQPVPNNFDRTLYVSERVFATAADGARIPISLVYRRDSFNHKNPLYIYGYGSYGYSLPVGFTSNRLSLLDRGLVLAYAHIRGGGELGKPWHDAGRLNAKMNTFTDFIAATEYLTAAGFGDPTRVAIEGGSAGGLLMGAVVNLRPELFHVVLSHVPFVDVMNTMLDASLPLTVPEYEEWGNPNEPEAFHAMRAYSPYDNLRPGEYPAMLVKTSLNDSQVMYWEPAKYVARLRTLKTDSNILLLNTNMSAGHGGASGRYDYLKEIAFDYAFLLNELGLVQQ